MMLLSGAGGIGLRLEPIAKEEALPDNIRTKIRDKKGLASQCEAAQLFAWQSS